MLKVVTNYHQRMPLHACRGRKQAYLELARRKFSLLSCHCVVEPICSLKDPTKARWNALHLPHAKLPAGAHRDASGMRAAGGEPCRHDRSHPVARLDAPHLLVAHEIAAREATLVHVGATVASPTHRRDRHRLEPTRIHPCQFSHAEGIQRMRFGEVAARPVPARASPAPAANGYPQFLKLAHQREARRVDGGGIPERGFGLRLHLRVAELGRRPVPFGAVAVMAGQHEVGHPVGAASAAGQLVVELKGHVPLPAVHAAVLVFFQQIGPRFPAGTLTPLVLQTADLRVLQQLRIEFHPFHLDALERYPPAKAPRPTQHVADPGGQRGREPPRWAPAVVETRWSVAQVGAATAAAIARALEHGLVHFRSPVAHLTEMQRVMERALCRCLLPRNGHARGLAARIDLERHRLQRALFDPTILEPDHERAQPMHHRPPTREQQARPFGRARHEWLLVSVNNEDHEFPPFSSP